MTSVSEVHNFGSDIPTGASGVDIYCRHYYRNGVIFEASMTKTDLPFTKDTSSSNRTVISRPFRWRNVSFPLLHSVEFVKIADTSTYSYIGSTSSATGGNMGVRNTSDPKKVSFSFDTTNSLEYAKGLNRNGVFTESGGVANRGVTVTAENDTVYNYGINYLLGFDPDTGDAVTYCYEDSNAPNCISF